LFFSGNYELQLVDIKWGVKLQFIDIPGSINIQFLESLNTFRYPKENATSWSSQVPEKLAGLSKKSLFS